MTHKKYSNYNQVASEINKERFKNRAISARFWDGCSEAYKNSKEQYSMSYMQFKTLWRKRKLSKKLIQI